MQERKITFPEHGVASEQLLAQLREMKADDFDWKRGRLPSYTYFFREEALEVQKQAYVEFIAENALAGSRVMRSAPQMLQDIRSWVIDLFRAPEDSGFSFTSGGTESVLLALKTCRDRNRSHTSGAQWPVNVVATEAAHPCLNKAAELMDIEVRRVPVGSDRRSDVEAMEAAIDESTIMVYTSAPSYPFGLFDDIENLAEVTARHNLWLHVDACWGGFISPFAEDLGFPIPKFDFRIPGVSSLSADAHKFGYAAKGAGILLYRDPSVQEFEKFSFSDWPRGSYETATNAGSKPAGSISAAWAVMQFLGREGYRTAVAETMEATRRIAEGAGCIPGLAPLDFTGESNLLNIVSTDPTVDIMAVAEELEHNGWFRGRMRVPAAIHQGVNPAHLPVVDEYLEALRNASESVRASGRSAAYDEHTY